MPYASASTTPPKPAAATDKEKQERFARLKEHYRQQLQAARVGEAAAGPVRTKGPVATTKQGPKQHTDPVVSKKTASHAPQPAGACHSDDDDEALASSVDISPLTTPGASYTARPPVGSTQRVPRTAAPVPPPSGVHPTSKLTASAANQPRPSFATDFANMYGAEDAEVTTRSAEPSASPSQRAAVGKTSQTGASSSTPPARQPLQARMRQRLPTQSGNNSPVTPTHRAAPGGERRGQTETTTASSAASGRPRAASRVSEQGTQVEQMESVMDYLESVTAALAHRTRSLPPPDSLIAFRASITPATRRDSHGVDGAGTSAAEQAHFSLLSELHEASGALLSSFSKLEYPRLPQDVTLEVLEQQTLRSCRALVALVEKIDRKFSTHESQVVRESYAERRGAVVGHRELVDAVARTAQHTVLLRRLVHDRDLHQVREVLQVHAKEVNGAATTAAAPAHVTAMLSGPYFTWLEQRWLPAMRSWKRVTHTALQEARSSGQYRTAIANAQRDALTVPYLHDILRPDETMTDLLRVGVVEPIEALASDGAELQNAMRALEAAMATPNLAELAKAIRHAQACIGERRSSQASTEVSPARRGEEHTHTSGRTSTCASGEGDTYSAEKACIKAAQQLLVQVQQAESSLRAMRMACQVPGSALSLFRVIHKANELLYLLELGLDHTRVQTIVRLCRPLVQEARESRSRRASVIANGGAVVECDRSLSRDSLTSWRSASRTSPSPQPSQVVDAEAVSGSKESHLVELFAARGLTVEDVYLPHTPSLVWTVACADAYHELCEAFAAAFAREAAQIALEGDLRQVTEKDDSSGGEGGVSADQLRRHLQNAEALGLSGTLVEQARERLNVSQTLRLKVHFQAQTRLIQLIDPTTTSFAEVYEQLYAFCVEQALLTRAAVRQGQELRIRYEDTDGDFISVMNDADWALMLSETLSAGAAGIAKPRRLDLFCDFPVLPGADPAVMRHQQEQEQQGRSPSESKSEKPIATPTTAPQQTKGDASPPDVSRSPGMTRTVELRLAAARARSAGVQKRTGTAAFAPRSRSGTGRAPRPRPQVAGGSSKEDSTEEASNRQGRRAGPRRGQSDAAAVPEGSSSPGALNADNLAHVEAEAQSRATVHKNILDGAKRWTELGPDSEGTDTLELMTMATTTAPTPPPSKAPRQGSVLDRTDDSRGVVPAETTTTPTHTIIAPHAKPTAPSLSPMALALPPRPNPHAAASTSPVAHNMRNTTPHRRLSRRGSHADLSASPGGEKARSTHDLMREMLRLQEEYEVAMHKRTTSYGS